MIYYIFVWFIFVILQQFTFVDTKVYDDDDDDPELRWSGEEGNSQNTYRAGINGDLYFFLSETRTHVGKYLSL